MTILNTSQAQAVYDAMCSLNNVSGAVWCRMPIGKGEVWADVRQDDNGGIHVGKGPLRRFDPRESVVVIREQEYYASQGDFAIAYKVV